MELIQKKQAKSKPGSRRSIRDNLAPTIPSAPMTHQPRRRLICLNRHTTRHDAPHHAPRTALSPHCQSDTTLHGSCCHFYGGSDAASLLWKTCG